MEDPETRRLRTIGKNVKALREGRKWGQKQLADAAKTSIGTVSRIERGDPKVHADKHADVARTLQTTIAALERLGDEERPHRFDALIEDLTHDFVGRDHIFEEITRFVARLQSERRGGYFVLRGRPGEGKSTIVARLAQLEKKCIVYFNQATTGSNSVHAFLQEIHAQLAARHSQGIPAPTGDAAFDGAWLANALQSARRQSAADILIAVDALDEVNMAHAPTANPLFLPPSLPAGVHVVATQRLGGSTLVATCSEEVKLSTYTEHNRRDVSAYIELFAEREGVSRWLAARDLPREEFVEVLVERSQENFMYLRHVLPMYERLECDGIDIKKLPLGLTAYYGLHWRRMGMAGAGASRLKLKILYVLAEIHAPVSRAVLVAVCDCTAPDVQDVLNDWSAFLRCECVAGENWYSLYHQSFQDFLKDQPTLDASGVDLGEVNRSIARWSRGKILLDD